MSAEKLGEIGEIEPNDSAPEKEKETDKEKKWNEFAEKLTALRIRIYEKINSKLKELNYEGHEGGDWISMRTDPFLKILKGMHKDYEKYAAYHILFRSSPVFEKSPQLDFPEESESIETFLIELEHKFDKWAQFVEGLKSLNNRVYKKAMKTPGDIEGYSYLVEKRINPFIEVLKKEKPDFGEYMAYHILRGSSVIKPYLDFSPPYSVKEFLLRCEKELDEGKE